MALIVLHITAHLGGGVGRVLSRLVEFSTRKKDGIRHIIACLEAPEKSRFVDHALAHGAEILICPTPAVLDRRIAAADIVQIEWWHHPVMAGWMNAAALPEMRLIVWSHVSGLHVPAIPREFIAAPMRFLFTSPCSYAAVGLDALEASVRSRTDAVFSSGGFDDLPESPSRDGNELIRAGYVGTLNFTKLHPDLLDFIGAIDLPGFRLALVGDPVGGNHLLEAAASRGLAQRIELRGYRPNIAAELAGFDVFVYLLNPLHYGTTENALLEAMAMGIAPIVLDNPAERELVRHGETGLIVSTPQDFREAIHFLATHPSEQQRIARAAASEIRQRFALKQTAAGLGRHYRALMAEEKRSFDFRPIFGNSPAEWFRACLGAEAWRFSDDGSVDLSGSPPHCLFETSKGSAVHYHRIFPEDPLLSAWARTLSQAR